MAKGDDFLERLWNEVINVDPKSGQTEEDIKLRAAFSNGPLAVTAPALRRLLERGVSYSDLQKLAAFVRFGACFDVLMALDDPGLGKGKIAGIQNEFFRWRPKCKPRSPREHFIHRLWDEGSFLDDNGKWLKDVTEKGLGPAPFNRTYDLVQRVIQKGKSPRDIGLFLGRSRAMACAKTLRRLEEGFERGDEPQYLHEEFDGNYPPVPVRQRKAKPGDPPNPTVPLWHIKPAQALAFSPDSKTLAVAGASGPVRLYDLASGQERVQCQGIKVHIYEIVFSPDGKQVTAAQIHKHFSVCDTKNGKLLHKLSARDEEVSGLEHAPTSEIISSSWCGDIAVIDSKTGKPLPVLKANEDDSMVDAITLFARGTRLATLCDGNVTVWTWPGRKRVLDFAAGGSRAKALTSSPDGKKLAVNVDEKGVHIFDAGNGKLIGVIGVKDLYEGLAFTADGSHVVVNHHRENHVSIWQLKGSRQVRKFPVSGGIFRIEVSLDGQYLAAATGKGALVWRLPPLLKSA